MIEEVFISDFLVVFSSISYVLGSRPLTGIQEVSADQY
jgi:hypothetical protein